MRSSAKKAERARALAFLLALGACCAALHGVVAHGQTSAAETALEALERREFESPEDPVLKERLAAAYWCAGQRGKAVEHWKWVAQFAASTAQRLRAEESLAEARKSPQDLASELGCRG